MLRAALLVLLMMITSPLALANPNVKSEYYGAGLCSNPNFKCIKVPSGRSWKSLFPNERERDLVQRLNRTDTYLNSGRILAIPKNFKQTTLLDLSPFPLRIKSPEEKIIIVDQNRLAWGAYLANGKLVRWGPISSGKNFCPDIRRSCRTITGIFYVFVRKGPGCKSNIFPVGRGGSRMPYCMFFFKGYALHGSNEVMGYRASHGCVRLFQRDAKWLNKNFVQAATKEGHLGTKVIVQKLLDDK